MRDTDERSSFLLPPGIRLEMRTPTRADVDYYVRLLLNSDWESPDSALQLADDLSPDEAGSTQFLDQSRQFLRLVVESEGVGLTPNGWLKLAEVARMVEKLDWPRRDYEHVRQIMKRPGERYVKSLMVIRDVCEGARLLLKRRDRLSVPRLAVPLLADAAGASLYRRLFIALFRDIGTDHIYAWDSVPWIDATMAVILWRVSLVAHDWFAVGGVVDAVLLTPVREQLEEYERDFPELRSAMLLHRVLEPLSWFGLLEFDRSLGRLLVEMEDVRFRKTPLFDRFVQFPPFRIAPPVEAS